MISDEDLLLFLTLFATFLILRIRRRSNRWRRRRWWVRPINQLRLQQGDYYHLYQQLKFDGSMMHRYIRMDLESFNEILRLVQPHLVKFNYRALPPEHRLLTSLRYYATGDLILSVSLAFRIGESTARNIIKEVALALAQVLAPLYLQAPNENGWLKICGDFLEKWNFPNCPGVMDGKHLLIKAPPNSGSLFYNYKKTFSIVLLAACDASYKFTLIHVGEMGSNNDAGIFNDSPMGQAIRRQEIGLPAGTATLPGSVHRTPPTFLGDGGFPLLPNLMVPYAGNHLDEAKRIFNYRLSRARRIIENSFGILSSRWRIFRRASEIDVNYFDIIAMATICLHNFLMIRDELDNPPERLYCPPRFVDWEENGVLNHGQWRENMDGDQLLPLPPADLTNIPRRAVEVRDILKNYFLTPAGEVPWQYDYVRNVGN